MRVITGTARGRKLQTLEGMDVRPTTDMVKEAVFSIIHFRLPYANVADVFAGSGQMGIEALSRGAKKATFVDNARASLDVIRQNLQTTGFTRQSKVLADDAVSFLAHAVEKYDIIFLDPPYNQGYGEKLLPLLAGPLADDGIVLFEHSRDEQLPDRAEGLVKKKDYRYGKIIVSSYVKEQAVED
ncbi:MAG: 16S rRNA (guanine(966)-N(2))-methyltransferase RsmD [Oscillospiraceae bacterium]|nr:16S rRNA (guanine(966)-N(2))-methyltransferase RsmD [Oscillospiraceae bacterium]